MEIRKVFRAGNSLVISLPRQVLETMGLQEGSRLMVNVERNRRALVLQPLEEDLIDIAREVIDQYRPFLEGGLADLGGVNGKTPDGQGRHDPPGPSGR